MIVVIQKTWALIGSVGRNNKSNSERVCTRKRVGRSNLRDGVLEATLLAAGHGGTDGIDNDNVLRGLDADLCGDGRGLGSGGLDSQVGRDLSETGGHCVCVCI